MTAELKATIVNMKTLSQNIPDPVVVGAGDANGRVLRVIFTQEAAAQFTPETTVYLSWHHQEKNIKGYNVFTEIKDEDDPDFPPTWEIKYPKSMLYEGNVLACIQLVDRISIATSNNFMIHILIDPNDGSDYQEDDYTDFQKMVIKITSLSEQMKAQLLAQKLEFEDMQLEFMDMRRTVIEAKTLAEQLEEAWQTLNLENFVTKDEITNFVIREELEDYVKKDELEDYVKEEELEDYAKKEDLENLATIEQLNNYVTLDQATNYVTQDQLTDYVTTDTLQEYATLGEVDEKLSVAIEEAQGEHDELWAAMQFWDYSEDDEEEG